MSVQKGVEQGSQAENNKDETSMVGDKMGVYIIQRDKRNAGYFWEEMEINFCFVLTEDSDKTGNGGVQEAISHHPDHLTKAHG